MATALKKRADLPINRDVLVWARERLSLTEDDAAEGAGVTPAQIRDWEKGPKFPTVKQARRLAEVYDRPFLEFFSSERPKVKAPELVPDFRTHRQTAAPKEQYDLILIQSEVEEVRLNALDLFTMLGEVPKRLPRAFFSTIEDDAERTAARVRAIVNLSVDEQTKIPAKERYKFVDILREKLEGIGILVMRNSGLARCAVRGLCFYADPLPIIVFSNESPSGQAFTLAHELAHVSLKQSAISGAPGSAAASAKKTEDWCDAFAAAFLVPSDALEKVFPKPKVKRATITDGELSRFANMFAISEHAMLIRLVNLGYVHASYYWSVKRAQFLAKEAAFKRGGRSKYYGSRYRSRRGDLYTGLVLEAWSNGAITNHSAAEFMGIKNFGHLEAIRDRFKE